MASKVLSRSFAGGEISPQLFDRLDLDKYQTGLGLCQNAWVMPQGPAQNRPGFQYVQRTKFSEFNSRLLQFAYSTQQTFCLEFGEGYIRFHTGGATLLEPALAINSVSNNNPAVFQTASAHGLTAGQWVQLSNIPAMPLLEGAWGIVSNVPSTTLFELTDLDGLPISTVSMPTFSGSASVSRVYEVPTAYSYTLLDTLNIVQSADVLTIVSPYYAPAELRRLSATSWQLSQIVFASTLSPPQSNGAVPSMISHHYSVYAYIPSPEGITVPQDVIVNNDLTIPGRFNLVSWNSQAGAITYYVYKLIGATWLYLGSSTTNNQFIDDSSKVPQVGNAFPPTLSQVAPALTVAATAVAPASTGVSVTPSGGGTTIYRYVVTSFSSATKEESIASGEASATNDLSIAGNSNTVLWPAVPGVSQYNVYRYSNGLWGFVGTAGADCIFVDKNILPETAITPPIQIDPFQGGGNHPRAVSYHEQRRVFAGTLNQPQTFWMTRSGTEKNLGYSIPSREDDGITQRVVAREAQTIRHIVPMSDMMLLTSGGEWRVASGDGGALGPSNISAKPQGYSGISTVPPVTTNRTILFAQDRGGHIREMQFSWEQQGYQTTDVSILAPHLFDYYTVKQMAFSRSPLAICWSVRSDGTLLGMTYVTEHEVRGWHRHITDGVFESCCTVSEGDEDVLYVIVRRVINGSSRRYVERLHTRRFDTAADPFFVDSGLTYSGPPVSEVSGLSHLEGKTVSILADGGVSPQQVVLGGRVSLDAPASKVHVGLPYATRITTLPLTLQAEAAGRGTRKNINKVYLRVLSSNGFKAGPDFTRLRPVLTRGSEPYGSPPDLITGLTEISMDPTWNEDGALCIEQSDPLPLMVLGLVIDVALGG